MRKIRVDSADLERRLEELLSLVGEGWTLLVEYQGRVVARIEPADDLQLRSAADEAWLARLERAGVVRRARGRWTADLLARRPHVEVDVVAALLGERSDGR